MTIAVMNTIKNKFTWVKRNRENGRSQTECFQSAGPTPPHSTTWDDGSEYSLNRYCHQCTQNGSILDFNQCLFALRAVSRNRLTYIFPLANEWLSLCVCTRRIWILYSLSSQTRFHLYSSTFQFSYVFFRFLSLSRCARPLPNAKCNQFQLKCADEIRCHTWNGWC